MSRKVLIIDDDADFRTAVGFYLKTHGYTVSEAHNGREGLRMAIAQHPDLILMDVMMEERTEGFFTLQQLRRTPGFADTPVFVVSSLYSDIPGFGIDPAHSWLRHDDFIAKPVNMNDLIERIEARLPAAARNGAAT